MEPLFSPPTDEEVQKWVYGRHGFLPHPAWIAHCKQLCGLPLENVRAYQQALRDPCPASTQRAIMEAFRDLGMLTDGFEFVIGLA